jgi:predicted short-subunit dehydrogenase-like oxidoreductase (DUF2520 family)
LIQKPTLAIIGAGKVGSVLAILLQKKNYPVVGVASRSLDSAKKLAKVIHCPVYEKAQELSKQAELIFITTPDREIGRTAKTIAEQGGFRSGQVVAHTSGAHAAHELRGVQEAGALAVSIHPLQSFADIKGAMKNLPGSYFALEGAKEALPLAKQVVGDLGGKAFIISAQDKPLYHAAACIVSNYLVSLMYFATGLYQHFGLSRKEAFQALFPLIQGTINNISRVGPVQSLTGPVSRGDGATIKDHLPALRRVGREELNLYRTLGLYTVRVGLEKGSINRAQAAQLEKIFTEVASKDIQSYQRAIFG